MRKSTAFEDQTIVQGMGNRIAKHVLNENFKVEKSTFYVLDASGNVMATYDKEIDYERGETFFKLKEHVVYGSSRVGIRTHDIDLLGLQTQGLSMRSVHYSIGSRQYELSNHLGNVLSVVSDKVIPYFYGGGIKDMRADIRVAQDYSPFGVTLSRRNFSVSEGYSYGFNNMENDDEVKGDNNSYDFGARMYDTRLGRWLSPDMLEKKYPSLSTYCFTNNNPVINIDFDGNDWGASTKIESDGSKTITLKLTAAVLNSSDIAFDMNAFKGAVETQVKNTYSVSWNEEIGRKNVTKTINGKKQVVNEPVYRRVNVLVEVDLQVISDKSELKDNQHLLEIVKPEAAPGIYGMVNKMYGKEVILNSDFVPNMINGNDNNTIVHELGHSFGLRHIDQQVETLKDKERLESGGRGNPQYQGPISQSKNPNNAMFSGGSTYMNDRTSTKLNPWQIRAGLKLLKNGHLNKK